MRKFLAACLCFLLSPISIPHARAQQPQPAQIELACPAGSQPLAPIGTAIDQSQFVANQRQWLCVDFFGNVFIQGLGSAPGVGSGPGGGTGGGGGGGGGGGTTGPTGSINNCLATSVTQGYACMGPAATPTGANPSFQGSTANVINTVPGANSITLTGSPIVATSSTAIIVHTNTLAATVTAPTGFSTVTNTSAGFIGVKNVTSTTSISPVVSWSGSPSGASEYLFFVGGNVSSTPVQSLQQGGGTCTNPAVANETCSVITLGSAVSASNFLLEFCTTSGSSSIGKSFIVDSLGDGYTNLGVSAITNNTTTIQKSMVVYLVQNPIAGTPTITFHSGESGTLPSCFAFELSGQLPYYIGTQGPPGFRAIQQTDLPPFLGGLAAYAQSTLSSNVTVTGSATNITTVTVRTPQYGCPCRAYIMYSGWANFAGVTNEPDIDFWVSDGTTNMIPFTSGQSNASTGATTTVSAAGISDVAYAGSLSITFTLKGIVSSANAGTIQFSYQAAQPTGGSGANSYLKIAIIPTAQ